MMKQLFVLAVVAMFSVAAVSVGYAQTYGTTEKKAEEKKADKAEKKADKAEKKAGKAEKKADKAEMKADKAEKKAEKAEKKAEKKAVNPCAAKSTEKK